jgi:hypothetical protein
MKKSLTYINSILLILFIVIVLYYFEIFKFASKEAFEYKRHSKYPKSQDEPLLYGYYNVKKNTNVTKNNNYNIWEEYPVYPNSYKQETNNKRYWSTPDNGLCSPAEFCGTPYSPTNIKKDKVTPGIPVGAPVTRVNWWASKR